MKKIYLLLAIIFGIEACSIAQTANTSLSNLVTPLKINHSLLPRATSLLNLGIPSKKWKNLYLSGTSVSDSVAVFGGIGIGIRNSATRLHVVTGNPGSMRHPYEAAVIETDSDHKLGVYTNVSNPNNAGSAITFGFTNFRLANSRYPGYEIQHGMYTNDHTTHFLRFNALERNAAGLVVGGYINEMIMDSKGNLGINLGNGGFVVPHATANLHVNGRVRFENLPEGSGNLLLIDADGNLFRSENFYGRPSNTEEAVSDEVTHLRNEVAALKEQVGELLNLARQKYPVATLRAQKRFLVFPNPANDVIRISSLGENLIGNKKIIFKNITGKTIQSFSMSNNNFSIPVKNILPGVYLVNIYQDDALLQSEKVVVK